MFSMNHPVIYDEGSCYIIPCGPGYTQIHKPPLRWYNIDRTYDVFVVPFTPFYPLANSCSIDFPLYITGKTCYVPHESLPPRLKHPLRNNGLDGARHITGPWNRFQERDWESSFLSGLIEGSRREQPIGR